MGTNDRAAISLVFLFLVCMASRSSCSLGSSEVQRRSVVPSIYVFGDSLVDVGNNNFLPPPAPRALSPYGIDSSLTGRFTNGYNLADLVGTYLFIIYVYIYACLCFCYIYIYIYIYMDMVYRC